MSEHKAYENLVELLTKTVEKKVQPFMALGLRLLWLILKLLVIKIDLRQAE